MKTTAKPLRRSRKGDSCCDDAGGVDRKGYELAGLLMFVLCVAAAEPVPIQPQGVSAKKPRVVLHMGDSMVGYGHGLSLAMKHRFDSAGIEYHWDAWTSAQIHTIDQTKMDRLLSTFKPDLVLFNLGTNMLTAPHPEGWAAQIRALTRHLAENGRECVWIAPIRPKWTYNPKLYDVIRENAAPCKYFDAGDIDPPLQTDHIHPTDVGGEQWAAPLWTFLSGSIGVPRLLER